MIFFLFWGEGGDVPVIFVILHHGENQAKTLKIAAGFL